MDLEKLIEKEKEFQPFLKDNHYTVIAPYEGNLIDTDFMEKVNQIAPLKGIMRSLHHYLGHKDSVHKVCKYYSEFKIFIVIPVDNNNLFTYNLEDYCKNYEIDFDTTI